MKNKTVGEIVASDLRTAKIFRRYGIDFCCGGGQLLVDVCKRKKVILENVLDEIGMLDTPKVEIDFNKMRLDILVNHILDRHHKYVKETIPLILQFSKKVAQVHGDLNPESIEISSLFYELAIELQQHMMKEEGMLFPHIKELVIANKSSKELSVPFGSFQNPIKMMIHEHDNAGNILKKIKKLSDNFTPPKHACNTYKALYHYLKEFQDDLHIHIHLENNILFPKALEMEINNGF